METSSVSVWELQKKLLQILGLLILALPLVYFVFLYSQAQRILFPVLKETPVCELGCQSNSWRSPEGDNLPFYEYSDEDFDGILLYFPALKKSATEGAYLSQWAKKHKLKLMSFELPHQGLGQASSFPQGFGCLEKEAVDFIFKEMALKYPRKKVLALGDDVGANLLLNTIHEMGVQPSALFLINPSPPLIDVIDWHRKKQKLPAFFTTHLTIMLNFLAQTQFEKCSISSRLDELNTFQTPVFLALNKDNPSRDFSSELFEALPQELLKMKANVEGKQRRMTKTFASQLDLFWSKVVEKNK